MRVAGTACCCCRAARLPQRRSFALQSGPACYVSDSSSPFVNLSFEDWLYKRSDPEHYLLFLYRNRASVIIGRNQNPWTELNMQRLSELDMPFVRRRSGGGTVYHDLGNINYCLLSPRAAFARRVGADMVTRAVRKLGIPAYVNERHDICVEQYKVSGSAFKIGSKRAYHHGTMLIDAALHDLRGVLRNTKTGIQSKGVASVSSPVRNLEEWSALIDHESFVEEVAGAFLEDFADGTGSLVKVSEADMLSIEEVRKGSDELQTWDWLHGQTPEFTHDLSHSFAWGKLTVHLACRRGLIESASVEAVSSREGDAVKSFLERHLPEERYGQLKRTLDAAKGEPPPVREALEWLMREM